MKKKTEMNSGSQANMQVGQIKIYANMCAIMVNYYSKSSLWKYLLMSWGCSNFLKQIFLQWNAAWIKKTYSNCPYTSRGCVICVREYIIQKRKSIQILETGGIKMPVQGRLKKKHLQNKDILQIKFNKILKFQSYLGIKKETVLTSFQTAEPK